MNNYRLILIICLFWTSTALLAQSGSAVKLNSHFTYDNETRGVHYGNIGVSYLLKSNRIGQEFILDHISFRRSEKDLTDQINRFELGLGYSFNYHFLDLTKIHPYIGTGALVQYTHYSYSSSNPSFFDRHMNGFDFYIGILPSLRFPISPRMFLDINYILPFYSLNIQSQRAENPSIPLSQQRNSAVTSSFPEQDLRLRMSIGLTL